MQDGHRQDCFQVFPVLWHACEATLLSFFLFCNNQVIVYNKGALLQKEKCGRLSLLLAIAGFAHHMNVHINNNLNTQLTISWFDNSSKDATCAIFALIQLALASQCDDIHKGSQMPCLVQVKVPAEGNEPAAIMNIATALGRLKNPEVHKGVVSDIFVNVQNIQSTQVLALGKLGPGSRRGQSQ